MASHEPPFKGGGASSPAPAKDDIIAGSDVVLLTLEDGEEVECYFPDTFSLGNKKGWAAILIHKAEYDAGEDYTFWVTGYDSRRSNTDRFYALPEHLEERAEATAAHLIKDIRRGLKEESDLPEFM